MTYAYAASVVEVHDGDSLTLDVDLGFHVHLRIPVRLLGCNARELAQPGGPEARDHLRTVLPVVATVGLQSVKTDKYARWDAQITLPDGSDLVNGLIAAQWAAAWDGTGIKPVPPWPRNVT